MRRSDTGITIKQRADHNLIERQDYLGSAKTFEECAKRLESEASKDELANRYRAWFHYLAAHCYYLALHYFGSEEYRMLALENVEKAMKLGTTAWYAGLQLVVNELKQEPVSEDTTIQAIEYETREKICRNFQEFKWNNSTKRRNPRQKWEQNMRGLLGGRHDPVCDILKEIFEIMGFEVRNMTRSREQNIPDLLLFSISTKTLIPVEVKTLEEEADLSELRSGDVDQIGGHRERYKEQYPDFNVYPLVFTNRKSIAESAIEKAENRVRILKAPEFCQYLEDYFKLMEQSWEKPWKNRNRYEKLKIIEKISVPEDLAGIFKPNKNPVIQLDELRALAIWKDN